MRPGRLLAAATLALAAGGAAAQASAPPRDALRLVETWLQAQVAYERVPGVAASIVIGPDVVWRGAFGFADPARRVPVKPDTAFGICSISKLFTAVAVMQLVEDGKLALDDDIGKLLPTFAVRRTDPDSGPISIRSLLTHASGLPREAAASYWTPPDFRFPTREQLLAGLATQQTLSRANERHQYSNLGMALLGEVVATASGLPYATYVQQRILAPLGLADTRPGGPVGEPGPRMAQGFGALRRDGTRQALPPYDARALAPAAGFSSTAEDLARFAAWNFRLRKNGGRELLHVATLREMQRVHWTDPDGKETWGLGFAAWRDGGNDMVAHNGTCPGQLSSLQLALTDEVATVALINANDNLSASRYTRPMRQLVQMGLKLPAPPADGPRLEDYAGSYNEQPLGSEFVVLPWGRDLAALQLPTTNPVGSLQVLRHAGGDRFRVVRADGSLGAEYAFLRDSTGRVTGYREWEQVWLRTAPP